MPRVLHVVFLVALLTACNHEKKVDVVNTDPEQLFNQGVQQIIKHDYKAAVATFETLEREHPASKFAPEANIRRIYAQYLNAKYDDGIIAAEEFIKQYPAHEHVDYVYYMLAVCRYDQIVDISRDQQNSEKAIAALKEVIQRFPNSPYARDAKYKMELAYSNLAGKEMDIGFFYLKQKNYSAASQRFIAVIQNPNYATTVFAPEALYRMVEVNYAMGMLEQAQSYAAVLGHNFPNSRWYQRAYSIMKMGSIETGAQK